MLNGLNEEVRVELINTFLLPENLKAIVPPLINPEVKVAILGTTLKRDTRLSNLEVQVATVISALTRFLSYLAKKGGETEIKYIETTNDALRLLCDVFHHESVTRGEFLPLNLNKDLKDTLQNTTISEYLFGKELDTTIEGAKKLEKSSEHLRRTSYLFLPLPHLLNRETTVAHLQKECCGPATDSRHALPRSTTNR